MTWQDIYCFFGFHNGKWGEVYEAKFTNYSYGIAMGHGVEKRQQYECKSCGKIRERSI